MALSPRNIHLNCIHTLTQTAYGRLSRMLAKHNIKSVALPSRKIFSYLPPVKDALWLWRWNRQSVPKRWHTKFRRRVITQKKAKRIQNTAKVWNKKEFISMWRKLQDTVDYSKNSSFAAQITPHLSSYNSIAIPTLERHLLWYLAEWVTVWCNVSW
jgi:hypothetical protein